jgi:hypothetical protein
MARTPKKTEVIDLEDKNIDTAKVGGALALMRTEATGAELTITQRDTTVRAVAQTLGYQLPADATDPDLIQRDIAANMRRSVEACLEVGKGLAVLKAACEHGQFAVRLDVLGIDKYVASRFIQSASKFSKLPSNATLKAIGNQTKLFEMLVLDDEEIAELELTGQTGELSLDDVATMSVKELRAALREARAEKEATDHLVETKNKTIDKLQREVKRFEKLPPDEKLAALQKDVADAMNDARGAVLGRMRQAVIALINSGDDRHAHDVFLAGMVGQVQAELAQLRQEFDLPDVSTAAEATLAAEVAQWAGKN